MASPRRRPVPAHTPRTELSFELIVESAPNAVIVADARGLMILVNGQAESLFGYDRREMLGQPVEMLVPERYRGAHAGLRAGFMRAPEARAMGAGRDLFGLRRDGSEVPIEIGLNPLHTGDGPAVLASVIDITERRRAADRLLESLREKEVMLREIHHRVKNNLAVIGSLLYLQSTTTPDARTQAVLQDCRDRVRSMALVHERLYRSEDLASVDFGAYADELARELVRNSGDADDRVRLRLECAPLPLAIDRAVPCGMILNELITNALRHAFPDGRRGEVAVSLRTRDGGRAELTVRDDGVGMAGAAEPADRTLGLRLVRSLARQVDAEFNLTGRGAGTEARLTLEVVHDHDNRP